MTNLGVSPLHRESLFPILLKHISEVLRSLEGDTMGQGLWGVWREKRLVPLGKELARSGLITDDGGDGDDDSFHAYSLPGSMAGDSYEFS